MAIATETLTATQRQLLRKYIGADESFINAKDYGALGDGRKITGLTKAAGSTTVLTGAASGTFTSDDVGKVAWAVIAGGTEVISLGVVSSITGSTSVTLSGTANTGAFSASAILYLGTDDTSALQAAWTAALSAKKSIYYPAGNYLFNRQLGGVYNVAVTHKTSIYGAGPTATKFFMMPDFATTGAVLDVVAGAVFQLYDAGPISAVGFAIDCGYRTHDMSGKYVVSLSTRTNTSSVVGNPRISDITIENAKGFTASISLSSVLEAFVENIFVYNGGYRGILVSNCHCHLRNVWSSNGSGVGISFGSASICTLISPYVDEHSSSTINVEGASTLFIEDSTIYGGAGLTCIAVTGNSKVFLVRSVVTPFSLSSPHNNSSGVNVASGSTVTVSNSTIQGTGTGKCATGAGTLIDEGGNTFTGTVDVTTKRGMAYVVPPEVPSATVAESASISPRAGAQLFITNETGGAVLAFGDGTNWRRVTDRAIVS